VPGPPRTNENGTADDGAGGDGAATASQARQLCLDIPPGQFGRECSFWSALTGWELKPGPVPEYVFLQRPADLPVSLLFQRRGSAVPGDRVSGHVDMRCSGQPAVLARHVAAGARVVARFPWWIVLRDPVHRLYCLTTRDPVTT
jgi:hypothetical protein